jgi:hypothetical protein
MTTSHHHTTPHRHTSYITLKHTELLYVTLRHTSHLILESLHLHVDALLIRNRALGQQVAAALLNARAPACACVCVIAIG